MARPRIIRVTAGPIAAVRRRTTFADVPQVLVAGLDAVWAAIRSNGLTPGHNVAVYRPIDAETVDLLCGVQVTERFADIGEVALGETPGGEAATMTHVGPYWQIGRSFAATATWARRACRRLAGVNWEIYGDWNVDPTKLATEIYLLLEPAAVARDHAKP